MNFKAKLRVVMGKIKMQRSRDTVKESIMGLNNW